MALTFFASIALLNPDESLAFNALGHRVVALVAEDKLTVSARSEVGRLLALEGRTSLSQVSSWADEIRDLKVVPQPAHSIRLLPVEGGDNAKLFCSDSSCVTGAIKGMVRALRDDGVRDTAKLMALKYLTHFVGDLHQPLHAASGGRDVILDGRTRTLHEIWDSTIVNSLRMKDNQIAKILADRPEQAGYMQDLDVEAWALEGRKIVMDDILPEIGGFHPEWRKQNLPTPILHHDYPAKKQAIVMDCLLKAGDRLAAMLNDIYRQ